MSEADKARLWSLESDLVHFHQQRMVERMVVLNDQLDEEEAKPAPDAEVIARLEAAMLQVERDKWDCSITEREVLQPLRAKIAADEANAVGRSS